MSSEIINFYTTDRIKKKLPKEKDLQQNFTKMKIDCRFLICGGSGTGKTNSLMNYIYQTGKVKNGTFTHVFLCFKTSEILYDDLIEQLDSQISIYKTLESFPDCNQFPDQTKDKYLCIFDDCVNEKSSASVKKINEYFAYSRKKGITCCFISQSYYDTPTFLRKNMNYLLLLSISGNRDLIGILREFNVTDMTKEKLQKIYNYAITPRTENDMPFLKITCFKTPDNEKYSRNFSEYIKV